MPRWLISILLIVLIFAAAIGGVALLVLTKPAADKKPIVQSKLVVRGIELEPRPVQDIIISYGTAQAEHDASVAAEIAGPIVKVSPSLQQGARVHDGEILLQIDEREYRAELARAKSRLLSDQAALDKIVTEEKNLQELLRIAQVELTVAQRELKRVSGLYENGLAGQRERDLAEVEAEAKRRTLQGLQDQNEQLPDTRRQLEATVELRKAELDLTQLNLERCSIKAPFDGQIQDVLVDRGERVAPGMQLFRMVDPDLIEVEIEVPLSWAPRVAQDAAVELSIEAAPQQRWQGKIVRLSPMGDSDTRTLTVFAMVDNRQQKAPLRPGTFVKAEIEGPLYAQALAIPRTAIMNDHVFIANQGLARRLPVSIEHTVGDTCLIDGVPAGTFVITSNLDSLADDVPIELESHDNAEPPATAADEPGSHAPKSHAPKSHDNGAES